jgi:hypothetical protein
MRNYLFLVLASFASACSQSALPDTTPPPDMMPPPDMVPVPFPAPHPDAPQVVTGGGPTDSTPVFVPVVWASDDATLKMQIEDFVNKVGGTNYWSAATKEYGVGAGTSTMPVEVSEVPAAMISDGDIQTWLAGKLNADDPAFPKPTSGTIYTLFYPAGVTISLQGGGGGGVSCQDFGGYHSDLSLDAQHNSMQVAYAVIPRCDSFGMLNGIDAITGTASHELIEAATDPFPMDNPAYGGVDDNHAYWEFALGGGETGDMCAQFPGSFTMFPELNYTVQRTWSNASAAAGHDPCVPVPQGEIYFNSAPELPDTIGTRVGNIPGVLVPVGMTKTIPLDLFSDADTGGVWTVSVKDYASLTGGTSSFQFTTDKNSGKNGDRIMLTIKSLSQTRTHHGTFIVLSHRSGVTHYWFGFIGQ